jgi:hypothetical protein
LARTISPVIASISNMKSNMGYATSIVLVVRLVSCIRAGATRN